MLNVLHTHLEFSASILTQSDLIQKCILVSLLVSSHISGYTDSVNALLTTREDILLPSHLKMSSSSHHQIRDDRQVHVHKRAEIQIISFSMHPCTHLRHPPKKHSLASAPPDVPFLLIGCLSMSLAFDIRFCVGMLHDLGADVRAFSLLLQVLRPNGTDKRPLPPRDRLKDEQAGRFSGPQKRLLSVFHPSHSRHPTSCHHPKISMKRSSRWGQMMLDMAGYDSSVISGNTALSAMGLSFVSFLKITTLAPQCHYWRSTWI